MQQWKVVVPWPATNKFILQAEIKRLADVEPVVRGAGGAQYFVTVYIPAASAPDADAARRHAIERLTEILGETKPRDDQIAVDGIEATLEGTAPDDSESAPAIEKEPPLEAEVVPLPGEAPGSTTS